MARSRSKNSKATAPDAGGIFFPMRELLGFDARELTPGVVRAALVRAVAGALEPGQRVVVTGQKNLTPGARIREATS